ncbi:MAG TPA: glucokinase [Gammaproteobacteria bacterium]
MRRSVARTSMPVHPILTADIGGTHARFLQGTADGHGKPADFDSGDYPDVAALVQAGLERLGMQARGSDAVLSLAGPIRHGRVTLTNLSWVIDAEALRQRFGFRHVALLNDLEAAAWCLASEPPAPSLVLRDGVAEAGARHAVVSASTGLGTAYWTHFDGALQVQAAEAGHTGFAPNDDWQVELLLSLQKRYGERVSWERVLSGSGLSLLEAHLRRGQATDAPDVVRRAKAGETAALTTVRRYCQLLGMFAGDLALSAPATGGIWFMGGVVTGLGTLLDREEFLRGFDTKGRLSAQVAKLPLRVSWSDDLGIRGAWHAAQTLFQ